MFEVNYKFAFKCNNVSTVTHYRFLTPAQGQQTCRKLCGYSASCSQLDRCFYIESYREYVDGKTITIYLLLTITFAL